jgi:pimeloyl-ACP methyl ester carboxylesterase
MSSKELAYSPCIIYCHGNAGNKIDIIEIFEFLLWDFNICSFDFSGAGHSEGDFVTLGFFEKDDIKAVVDFLRNELNIQKIILYGRSMGAVSSLRYAEMDPNIKAIVLDSPFSSFPNLCGEILSNKFYIPNMVSSVLISMARDRILQRVENFDINDFVPYSNAKKVQVPTIMIHGKQDSLVSVEHSKIIFEKLHKNTYKKLLEVEGEHNDCRSQEDVKIIRDFIMQFAYDSLVIKEHKRRLNIKNAHLNYTTKYGININSVITNFRNTIKSQSIKDANNSSINRDQKRKMNNFNIYGQIKKNNICISDDRNFNEIDEQVGREENKNLTIISKEKIRSKSTDTMDDELLASKYKKENLNGLKAKIFNRGSSNRNNRKFKKNENLATNNYNIKIIKYHEYSHNTIDKEGIKIKSPNKKEEINVNTINFNFDGKNPIAEVSDDLNKSNLNINNPLNPLNESQLQIDNISGNRYVNFNTFPSLNSNNKNKLRNERNNILGGILGCEVRVKSDQITFTNLDKSSIRKKSQNSDSTFLNNSAIDSTNKNDLVISDLLSNSEIK